MLTGRYKLTTKDMRGNDRQRIVLDSGEYVSLITHMSCLFGESQGVCKQQISE
jgi:hypothetical protein